MLRLTACAAILAGCGYLGIMLGSCYHLRCKQLGEFRRALKQLEFDVDFLSITLCESFEKIVHNSCGGVKSVFEYVTKRLKENRCDDMEKYWVRALKIYGYELKLNDEDKRILTDFAKNLGTGNRETELNNIRAADMRLKVAEEDACREAKKNSKMYRGLGFLSGIFLVIVLV